MLRVLLLLFCALNVFCFGAARADEILSEPETVLPPPALPLEVRSTRTVAPGIELTTIRRNAPLQIFIAKIDPKAGTQKPKWKLKLATGGATVFDFAPTSQIAAREKAIVGINGGYFAFGGAALGALKIDGEWIRLPIKNRTAVGFDEGGGVLIDSLLNDNTVWIYTRGSTYGIDNSVLNGYPSPATSVITWRFSDSYKLRQNEEAVVVEEGKVLSKITSGTVTIPRRGWAFISKDMIRDIFADMGDDTNEDFNKTINVGDKAVFKINEPDVWEKYPTILGAGPRLLKAGKIFTTETEEEFRPDVLARGPRSAFGVDAKGNWIFLVCDGREKEYSAGLSIPELALEMLNAGAVDALCLDGGGSSTLVVDNQVINRPSDGTERKIPDAILVVPVEDKK